MNDAGAFLYDVLMQRKSRNQSYSIRAFARDLGLSPAFVSQVLGKKRNLSLEQKIKVATHLGIRFSKYKSKPLPESSKLNLNTIELAVEHDKILKYWHHFAILSLAQINHLTLDAKVTSKRLGITPTEAKAAITRLVSFGYLAKENGRLARTKTPFIFDSKKSSRSLRQFHRSRLMAAEQELDFFDQSRIDRRHFQTLFIPSSRAKVQAAKSLVTKFQDKLISFLMEDSPEEIFQLSLQLFSVEPESRK